MQKRLYIIPVMAILVFICGFAIIHPLSGHVQARHILYYVDPMHPAYRSDKPGTAPDCGMALVPVYAEQASQSLLPAEEMTPGGVQIDPAAQQLYGIRLAKVEYNNGQGTIRVFGRVAPDQTRVYRVNLGTDGFVKETHDDAVGNHVTKNQHLAIVYSPEFLAVAGGYLSANERAPAASSAVSKDNIAPSSTLGAASAQARADRLRNLGMSDFQIDEISMNRKIPENIYVVSPTDGFILSRNISPGVRFERYMEMYTIADLSHVWINAEAFGKDVQEFRPGAAARIILQDTGEVFHARVSDVLPQVDPVTHILKPRLELDNPGFKLRPDMFVNIELQVSRPAGLTIPADAILDSGFSKRVFVQTSIGHFESRTIETGWRFNDDVQIVKGLQEGETVVSGGTFLVDSESRLLEVAHSGSAKQNTPSAETSRPRAAKADHAMKMNPSMKMDQSMQMDPAMKMDHSMN